MDIFLVCDAWMLQRDVKIKISSYLLNERIFSSRKSDKFPESVVFFLFFFFVFYDFLYLFICIFYRESFFVRYASKNSPSFSRYNGEYYYQTIETSFSLRRKKDKYFYFSVISLSVRYKQI